MPKNNKANQESKIILKGLLVKWKAIVNKDRTMLGDERLYSMIRDVKEYSNMDHTVSYAKEGQLYHKILTEMKKYSKDLENKMLKTEDPKLSDTFSMVSDLNGYFLKGKDGYLNVPVSRENHIISHDKQLQGGQEYGILPEKMVKYKDTPLFSHDPSLEDLKHGSLKNGNINAALGILVQQNPNFIKESMMDNKDGTVTVRLFQEVRPVDQGKEPGNQAVYQPVYVTVDKSLPEGVTEQNSLWVSIYEKALAASGMFYGDKDDPAKRPVPGNIDQLYDKYKKLPKTEWPTRQQCPWLIDEHGDLHKWNPSYEHLKEKGNVINTLECIIGEPGRSSIRTMNFDTGKIRSAKKDKALETVYREIIRNKVGGDDEKFKKFMDCVGKPRKANPETYLTNLRLCAALLSSMSLEEAETHIGSKKIKRSRTGKITSFPSGAEQKMLEHLETELDKRMVQLGENGKQSDYEGLIRVAAMNAQYQVQHDPDQEIAALANGEKAQSLGQMTNVIMQQAKEVYQDVTSYSLEEENVFKELTSNLDKGEFMVAGTKPSVAGGEMEHQPEDGLQQEASYAVLGVVKEVHKGREYKYVLVSDPENRGGELSYDYTTHPPKPVLKGEEIGDGIKKIELNHFCKSFQQFTISGREKETIQLPENMMTREIISDYSNFLSYFEQQMEKELGEMKTDKEKKDFQELKKDISEMKKNLTDSLGKDMRSVSFKDIREKAERYREALENTEKPNPNQIKLLNRIAVLSRMYDSGLKNPKALLMDSLEKSMEKENMFDAYHENNCARTVINSHQDIKNLSKEAGKFSPDNKQFKSMQNALKRLDELMDHAEPGRILRKEYTSTLENLFRASRDYLEQKENERGRVNGVIKASGSKERKMIEMAEKIRDYSLARNSLMQHQNLRDTLKLRTAYQLTDLTKNKNLSANTREFRSIVNSDTLNEILEKASDSTIEKILRSNEAAKTFAEKVNLQLGKSEERQPLERFRNDALKALDSKHNNFEKREYLARLFFADAMKSANPKMTMGQLRKYEKDVMEDIVASDTINSCINEIGALDLDKEKALKLLGKYGKRLQKEIKNELEFVKKGEPIPKKEKKEADIDKDLKEVDNKIEDQKKKEEVLETNLEELEMGREK